MMSKAEKAKLKLVTLQVDIEEEEEGELEEDALAYPPHITSQICLKTMHPSEKMDRDVVLRRIRHHKRVKKVKGAVEAFFGSPFSTTATINLKDRVQPPQGWVEDVFSAP